MIRINAFSRRFTAMRISYPFSAVMVFLVLLQGSCTDSSTIVPLAPPVARIVIDPPNVSLESGGRAQLTAALLDAAGNALSGRRITWESTDTGVAEVDSTGEVRGVGPGTSQVTATSEGQSGRAAVSVMSSLEIESVNGMVVRPGDTLVAVDSLVVVARISLPEAAGRSPHQELVRDMPDDAGTILADVVEEVVAGTTVERTFRVPTAPCGSYALRVEVPTSAGVLLSPQVPVRVVPPVARILLAPDSVSLQPGGQTQLTARLLDAAGNALSGRRITWASTDTGVAEVDSTGEVRGVGPGTSQVTATSEGQIGKARVTVPWPLEIESVNGVPVQPGDTLLAEDSLVVVARISLPEAAGNSPHQTLVRNMSDGTRMDLDEVSMEAVAGETVERTFRALAPPSGSYPVSVEAPTSGGLLASPQVPVRVHRPEPTVRILSINGQPVVPDRTPAVDDSFAIVASVEVPQGSRPLTAVWLTLDGGPGGTNGVRVGADVETIDPGVSRQVSFTAYTAPSGEYWLKPEAVIFADGVFLKTPGDSVEVATMQSDVTPPKISWVTPTDSETVGGDGTFDLVFDMEDDGGLWSRSITFDWWFTRDGVSSGPCTTTLSGLSNRGRLRQSRDEGASQSCFGVEYLQPGPNPIIVSVRDNAWNETIDTLIVIYDSSAAAPPAVADPRASEWIEALPVEHREGAGLRNERNAAAQVNQRIRASGSRSSGSGSSGGGS